MPLIMQLLGLQSSEKLWRRTELLADTAVVWVRRRVFLASSSAPWKQLIYLQELHSIPFWGSKQLETMKSKHKLHRFYDWPISFPSWRSVLTPVIAPTNGSLTSLPQLQIDQAPHQKGCCSSGNYHRATNTLYQQPAFGNLLHDCHIQTLITYTSWSVHRCGLLWPPTHASLWLFASNPPGSSAPCSVPGSSFSTSRFTWISWKKKQIQWNRHPDHLISTIYF